MDNNKILVVIDMQNDFIDGSLGTKEAQEIVPKVVEKIRNFDEDGDLYVTKDTHDEDYLDTQEGIKLPVKHCIFLEDGWYINKDILKVIEERGFDSIRRYFNKPTFGSFRLADHFRREYKYASDLEITLVGLCTDICVISNAMLIKSVLPEAKITVDASCCAGVTPESHKNALEAMKMCQIEVINE